MTAWTELADQTSRDTLRSILRGFLGRCPHCGKGALFRAYLKPVANCAACGEDLSHQRADDAPPYLTIFVVGHAVVAGMMALDEAVSNVPVAVHLAIWPAVTLALSLLLLPRMKGAVIGLQWAQRMHGFGGGNTDT